MLVSTRKKFVNSCDKFLSGLIKIDNSTKNLEEYYSTEAKNLNLMENIFMKFIKILNLFLKIFRN